MASGRRHGAGPWQTAADTDRFLGPARRRDRGRRGGRTRRRMRGPRGPDLPAARSADAGGRTGDCEASAVPLFAATGGNRGFRTTDHQCRPRARRPASERRSGPNSAMDSRRHRRRFQKPTPSSSRKSMRSTEPVIQSNRAGPSALQEIYPGRPARYARTFIRCDSRQSGIHSVLPFSLVCQA